MSNRQEIGPGALVSWKKAAASACQLPLSAVSCPACCADALSGEWHLLGLWSREMDVDLHCSACGIRESVRIPLPVGAAPCWPFERLPEVFEAAEQEIKAFAARVQQHVGTMPAAAFTTHPLWAEAKWNATTYKWHPTSDAPPVMGLVFENEEAGLEIFRDAERQLNHEDRFEEIRLAIIEGPVPGQEHRPGYSVHICADPEALAGHATMDEFVVDSSIVPFLGQWNRHYPVPGAPPLLPRFKAEFKKHQEFLLAPTIRRNGQLYMEPRLGIVKNVILFRQISEITTPDDIDAAALVLPALIMPPVT